MEELSFEEYLTDDVMIYCKKNGLDIDVEDYDEVYRLFKTVPLLEEDKRMKLARAVVARVVARRNNINRIKGKDSSHDKQKDKYRSDARKKLVDAIRASKTQLFTL